MSTIMFSILAILVTSSAFAHEKLPVVNLICTNGVTIAFQETKSSEGRSVDRNEIEFNDLKVEIQLTNTFSGLRSVRGKIGGTDFLLEELADASYWTLNQAVNGVAKPLATCSQE